MSSIRYAALLAAVLAPVACSADPSASRSPTAPALEMTTAGVTSGGTASETWTAQDDRILRQATDVSIPSPVASMWAVRGQSRTISILYADGSPVVTFTVGGKTLVADAAGRSLAKGDSVLITMRLVDPVSFAVDMQPAGIVFAARYPAKLKFNLQRADNAAIGTRQLSFWKRESALSPWQPVAGKFNYQVKEGEVAVPGFTIYAIIY